MGKHYESYADVLQLEEVIMDKLLESFLEMAKGDGDKNLSVETLLTDDERFEWETLVKAFDSIDIMNVGRDLEKIVKTYKLNRWQELSILAYVKLLEMMVKRARDSGAIDHFQGQIDSASESKDTKHDLYSGSMFG